MKSDLGSAGGAREATTAVLFEPMARTIQKPGMYCEQCDRPISAQKNKHGARNTFAVVTFAGLGAKVEDWHCPECGGPAITVADHERNLQFGGRTPSLVEMFKGPSAVAEAGAYSVRIHALPKPEKGPKGWSNLSSVSALAKALGRKLSEFQGELENLPYIASGMTEPRARGIVSQFTRFGGRAEIVPPPEAPATAIDSLPTAAARSEGTPVEQIKQLGELKDAGLITPEEFDRKKAELLDRI